MGLYGLGFGYVIYLSFVQRRRRRRAKKPARMDEGVTA
jgi:hypothetical protein